ncbi:oligosaccharide flippase family protein [bacterium]|nr:oligosaccharide flippase family protein [bacterium]
MLIAKAITKEDLGIFREFSLVLAIFTGISYFGFKDLLIVKKDDTKALFQQLFLFSIIISIVAWIGVILVAPSIGKYYKSELLASLLIRLSPLICLEILRIAVRSYYQKLLKFKLLSIIETINVLVYSALIIIFFFFKLDISSLIIIFYFGNLVEFILLLSFETPLIIETSKRLFTRDLFRDFFTTYKDNFRFLLTATSNNIISQLINDLPVIILGILFNPVFIGIYYLANQLIGQPVVLACNSLRQVLFPTFTFMNNSEIYSKLHKFFSIVTLLAFPLLFLLVIYIMNLVPLALGDKWNEALPIVAILAFPLATTMLMNPISSLPYVLELPHVEMVFMIISLTLKSLAIYLGHYSGFETALTYYALVSVIIHLGFIGLVTGLVQGKILSTLALILLKTLPTLAFIALYLLLGNLNFALNLLIVTSLVGIYLLLGWKLKFITLN